MSTRINPPGYSSAKNYERYKQELLAWREITDLQQSKQGIAVALSLPEESENQIREKVFDQISIGDLKSDDGLDILIAFMDLHLAKDDLTDNLEKFEDFDDFQRSDGQSIGEFIATFDAKYKKIEKKNMTLPPEILAFKLLRKAKITREEKLLVLTGMNYDNKATLYEEAKKSLKKFKGDANIRGTETTAVKFEPAYFTNNQETAFVAGSSRGRGRYHHFSRGAGNAWDRREKGRGYDRLNVSYNGTQPSSSRSPRQMQKNKNPIGPDGRILVCKSCGSFRHLLAACPDSWENLKKVNIVDEHAVLFTGYNSDDVRRLGTDARNCAILDSACSSTVCGDAWMKNYIQSLDYLDRAKVQHGDGVKVFKFGGGTCLKSKGEYVIPAVIAGQEVTITTDVVDSDIPLLLSRTAMKKAALKMDLENDTAQIMGKDVSLNLTTSGHYCIPIDKYEEVPVESVCAVKLDTLNRDDRSKILLKLHRQFGHPPMKRLIALLKDAGMWRDEYEENLSLINERCEICKRYSRTPSRPVVALPMASKFNEKVSMDLKQWGGRWILHIIDMWSRYTLSVFVERKKSSCIIEALITHWIGRFGVMKALMVDNGGEFNSDEMRDVTSILNVKLYTTAAESPFQNGLCERVHSVTDMMLTKLTADYANTNSDVLLSWANMARNSLQMWNGYSSHQLVFGENPNIPNVLNDNLPALEGVTNSEVFAKHLNALHGARRAFIQTEADERIRRALRNKIRASEEVFENGDSVFYKREGKERWLGPGKVVFQDGKVVFVRHGSVFVRVSPNRLQKSNDYIAKSDDGDQVNNSVIMLNKKSAESSDEEEAISEDIGTPDHQTQQIQEIPNVINVPKTHDYIKYRTKEDDEWIKAMILGRAGKASGRNRYWYNIQEEVSKERKSINLEQVQWEHIQENVNIAQTTKDGVDEITAAKLMELEKLHHFKTYVDMPYNGQTTLSTRWVITERNGQTKARLVVRGFEEEYDMPRDSPTVGKGTMRTFLTFSAANQWKVKTTDIKSAFLQGKEITRDVYIQPPRESNTPNGMVWKLKHGLYGLKDGARQFYLSVKEELLRLKCSICTIDPALFFLHRGKRLCGIICCHVDDFLHAGDEDIEVIMNNLRSRFLAGKIDEGHFDYIGFRLDQESDNIVLDQSNYVEKIRNVVINPTRARNKQDVLSIEEQSEYRKLVGQLNWVVQGTRPDMAFELIDMSTKLKQGRISDLSRVIKVINRLKDTKSIVKFPSMNKNIHTWKIIVFTDASLCNINDGTGSTAGHIVMVMDRHGESCPLYWHSGKIKRVVRSTIAAEALSLQEGIESAFYYRHIIEEVAGIPTKSIPIIAYVDNKSVIEAVYSTRLVDDKRLRVDIAAISESLNRKEIDEIRWCPGKVHLADCLTKRGAQGLDLLNVIQEGILPAVFL